MEDRERDEVKKILAVLGDKLKRPENSWLYGEMQKMFSLMTDHDEKIDAIFELCVEQIIKEQAIRFYEYFPIESIKHQLVTDFIRMENFRRKDQFEDFCLAMYQQIECVTNCLGKDDNLNMVFEHLLGFPAYVKDNDYSKRLITENPEKPLYLVADLLFNRHPEKVKRPLSEQYAIDKIRSIVYFVTFKGAMSNNDYERFVYLTDSLYEIYQYRNKNHRGNVIKDFEKKIYDKIDPHKSLYCLKFMGVLADFIESICEGFPLNTDFVRYCKGLEKKEIKPKGPVVKGYIELSEKDLTKKRF